MIQRVKSILRRVSVSDLAPPIFGKVSKKLRERLRHTPRYPFDNIPQRITPRWVLDVGANVGDVSLAALRSYPDCQVICFEPVQETFAALRQTLKGFEGRTHLYNMALSTENAEGEINITSFHGANSIVPQSELHKQATGVREVAKQKIELVRLDDICARFPTKHVDVMKIDVEGFELSVLEGGFNFISTSVDLIIVELALYRSDSVKDNYVADVFLFMKKAGFSLINVYDLAHISHHPYLRLGQMDCVFINNARLT